MLSGKFFNIAERSISDHSIRASLDINASHEIFEGHFPAQPVVPGVCMLQMIKELVEIILGKKVAIKRAGHLKFLAVINPLEHPAIDAEFTYDDTDVSLIIAQGRLFKDELTFLKFRVDFALPG